MKLPAAAAATAALIAWSLVAVPAQGQTEQQLFLVLNSVTIDESVLNEGRLPPESAQLKVEFNFEVQFPPVIGLCPFQPITVYFDVINPYPWAFTPLTVTHVSKSTGQLANPLTDSIKDFKTTMTLVVSRDAPAFYSAEFSLKAHAAPGAGLSGGCNLKESSPLLASFLVKIDYYPSLEVSSEPWRGRTPGPISVTNHGNGATRVTFAWVTDGGELIPSARNVLLESRAQKGDQARTTAIVVLDRGEIPQGWNRQIEVTGASELPCACESATYRISV